jgi:uncharacterized protein YhaN
MRVDRFGILQDQEIHNMPPGLCLFLGRNEAGKSTCLRFFQSILFGYRRGNRSLDPMSQQRGKGLAGGSLFLRTRDFGLLALVRRPGSHGGIFSLNGENGASLDEGILRRLFGGLSVEVFDNIFAFSLKNLMDLSALRGDGVRHALHGAAFGLGLRSPAQALRELEDRMSALLNRDFASSSAAINLTARELVALREEIRARIPDMQLYTELQDTLETLESRLSDLHAARVSQELSLRRVQRRLAVWRQWEEARNIREEWMRLRGEAPFLGVDGNRGDAAMEEGYLPTRSGEKERLSVFAPDSIQRLDAMIAQQEERLTAERETERACALLQKDIAALLAASSLANLYPALQSLREQKSGRRDEAERLPALEQECSALRALQEQTLLFLGAGWDAERVFAADVSMASRESVLRHGKELAEKESSLLRVRQEKNRLAEELAASLHLEETARRAVDDAGTPEYSLPEKQRAERFMAGLTQVRAAAAELPLLRERAAGARQEAADALGDIDPAWTTEDLHRFDSSLFSRQCLAARSTAITEARVKLLEAQRVLRLAEESSAAATEEVALREQRCSQYGSLPDASSLETRYGLLRQIERLSIELASARRDHETADAGGRAAFLRIKKTERISTMVRDPLFLVSVSFVFLGLIFVGALLLADITFFLYAGAGFSLFAFAAGLLRSVGSLFEKEASPRADAHTLRYVRFLAESRRHALMRALAGLAAEASSWLIPSVPGEPGEADIERTLRFLEAQGQKAALLERERQELAKARQALASADERLARASGEERATEEALAASMDAWRGYLISLKLSPALRPETASGIFDRAATARARAAVAVEAEKSLAMTVETLAGYVREACEMPFFTAFLPTCHAFSAMPGRHPVSIAGPGDDALLQRCLAALEPSVAAYRRCEENENKRRELCVVLKERTESRVYAEQRLAWIEEGVEAAATALREAQDNWQAWLGGFGLASSLSPQNALEALDAMSAFTAREKKLQDTLVSRDAIHSGLEDFVREIALLAHRADKEIPAGMELSCAVQTSPGQGASFRQSPDMEEGRPNELRTNRNASGHMFVGAPLFSFRRPAPPLVPAALHLLEALAAEVEDAVRAKNRLSEKQEQLAGRSQDLLRTKTALELTRDSINALLAGAGMPDAEHFRAAFAGFRKMEELRAQERSLLAGIRSLAEEEGEGMTDMLASLERSNLDDLREKERGLAEEIAGMEREMRDLSVTRGQLIERREALAGNEGKAPLLLRESALQEKLHRLSRQWSVLALARDFLLTAKSRFEEEGQQGVIRFAGDLFSSITDGEYAGIAASLEGDSFTALHSSGDRRDPEKHLSQGTREQMYLALRLAYIKNHAANAESLPVIMDDILVNFDPVRSANTAKVLATFARDNQVLFFTCHPGTIDTLLQAAAGLGEKGPASVIYRVDRGTFSLKRPSAGG